MKRFGFFIPLLVAGASIVNLNAGQGRVNYIARAGASWDQYTLSPDATMQAFIRNNLTRLATYAPYFDTRLAWMPYSWVYIDAYAIYTDSALVSQHPEWILKDPKGNRLFIPWGCANGTCPQYAGNIANPAYRAYQIQQIKNYLAANGASPYGYRGVFLDDVNLNFMVGDGNGNLVAPIDTNTGTAMTATAWEGYFATFVEQIKDSLPNGTEILHNSVWFAGSASSDSNIRRQIAAANYINVERGFGDDGLTGGTGQWSVYALMQYIDTVHSIGTAVLLDNVYLKDQIYDLACYHLINNGFDAFGIEEETPGNLNTKLYSIDLGRSAVTGRYRWSNLWRRDFNRGIVLMNEPGAPAQTVTLPAGMVDLNGNPVSVVTLGPKQGGVYRYAWAVNFP